MTIVFPLCAKSSNIDSTCSAAIGVEIAGRFVGEDHSRIVRQRARQGNALLLPDAQLARFVVEPFGKTDRFEQRGGFRASGGFRRCPSKYSGTWTFSKAVR